MICVEAGTQSKSDWMYIKSTIEHFYGRDNSNVKLSPIFMGGKGNYKTDKIRNKIRNLRKQYSVGTRTANNTYVLLAVDCDECLKKYEDSQFIEDIRKYCKDNGYEFVWFCRDIEEVYLGKTVNDSDKKSMAEVFFSQKKIKRIDSARLKSSRMTPGNSNLMVVLDKYLSEK